MRHDALIRHPLAIAGLLVTTVSAVAFVVLAMAVAAGLFENPYAGLLVFIAVPTAFVVGLLLVPAGMWLQRRRIARDPGAADWPVLDFRRARVRRLTLLFSALTAVNVAIVLLASYGSVHWMESPGFCGQTCHTPMQPQFTAWRQATHSRIACVACHVGEGARGFVHAKLSGVRQMIDVARNSYSRPIPAGAQMPEGEQAKACGRCHQPGRATGDQIRVIREYADDEASTETMTVLRMHVGAGSVSGRAIHWHADPSARVEYVSTDETNETIPYVRVTDANGRVKEYVSADAGEKNVAGGPRRAMGCIDCHNTVGHPIAPTAERAVDRAIAAGLVSRQLPFARREAVRLMTAAHASVDEALPAIERGVLGAYQRQGGAVDRHALARTVSALQTVYSTNVFPEMKVTWGSYPDHKGHITSTGCFRCHDGSHAASDGSTINADCEYCHKQIEPGAQ